MVILSVHFLWRAHTLGGFPYSVQHMAAQVEVTSGSTGQAAHPNIDVYTERAQFV